MPLRSKVGTNPVYYRTPIPHPVLKGFLKAGQAVHLVPLSSLFLPSKCHDSFPTFMLLLPSFNLQWTVLDAQGNPCCSNPSRVCLLHLLKPSFFLRGTLQAMHSFQIPTDSPKAHSYSHTRLSVYPGVRYVLMPLSVPLYMQTSASS